MSTDWGIGCRTCRDAGAANDFTGEWNNCRDVEGLWKLIRAREAVVLVHAALGAQVSFSWHQEAFFFESCQASDVAKFFLAHEGHQLAPMDEYGRFDGQCWKWVRCEGCDGQKKCVLGDNHSGECTPRKASKIAIREDRTPAQLLANGDQTFKVGDVWIWRGDGSMGGSRHYHRLRILDPRDAPRSCFVGAAGERALRKNSGLCWGRVERAEYARDEWVAEAGPCARVDCPRDGDCPSHGRDRPGQSAAISCDSLEPSTGLCKCDTCGICLNAYCRCDCAKTGRR